MKLLLYCCKAKPYLFESINEKGKYMLENDEWFKELNGKIVAECDFEVETYLTEKSWFSQKVRVVSKRICDGIAEYNGTDDMLNFILNKSCLTIEELTNYMNFENNIINQKELYAIHIKNLHIFDKPKELADFTTRKPKTYDSLVCDSCTDFGFDCKKCSGFYDYQQVMKAPQNMMKVCEWDIQDNILISIRPEWLCKILNGEKTIEVRKKVLKEMLE